MCVSGVSAYKFIQITKNDYQRRVAWYENFIFSVGHYCCPTTAPKQYKAGINLLPTECKLLIGLLASTFCLVPMCSKLKSANAMPYVQCTNGFDISGISLEHFPNS